MNWKEKISGCFGDEDLIFGGHQFDLERAMEMFKEALKEDVKLDDIVKECKNYLKSKKANKIHIKEQETVIREFCYRNLKLEE